MFQLLFLPINYLSLSLSSSSGTPNMLVLICLSCLRGLLNCPHIYLCRLKKFFFHWSTVDLQCCISLRCIVQWFGYKYTYIYSFIQEMSWREQCMPLTRAACSGVPLCLLWGLFCWDEADFSGGGWWAGLSLVCWQVLPHVPHCPSEPGILGGLSFHCSWHEECSVRLGPLDCGGEPLQLWLSTRRIGLDCTTSPTSDPSPWGSFDVYLVVENLSCCSLVHAHR